jgi:hypothetical protein
MAVCRVGYFGFLKTDYICGVIRYNGHENKGSKNGYIAYHYETISKRASHPRAIGDD